MMSPADAVVKTDLDEEIAANITQLTYTEQIVIKTEPQETNKSENDVAISLQLEQLVQVPQIQAFNVFDLILNQNKELRREVAELKQRVAVLETKCDEFDLVTTERDFAIDKMYKMKRCFKRKQELIDQLCGEMASKRRELTRKNSKISQLESVIEDMSTRLMPKIEVVDVDSE